MSPTITPRRVLCACIVAALLGFWLVGGAEYLGRGLITFGMLGAIGAALVWGYQAEQGGGE